MSLTNLKSLASLAQTAKQGGMAGTQVLKISVNKVRPKSDQVRKNFSGLEELAESLLQEGQIQPIIVSPEDEYGIFQIQKGERRWRACKLAGLKTVDAIINDAEQTDLDATAGELIENIQRDDLEAIEIANALQNFVEAGWKQKDIAKRIGKTPAFISSHMGLLKMPSVVKALYDDNITRDPETLNNLRQLYDLDSSRCEQLCVAAQESGISRVHSRDALNYAKQGKGTSVQTSKAKTKKRKVVTSTIVIEDHDEWRPAKPAQLRFNVLVSLDGEHLQGSLVTNRIDNDPEHVWVEFPDIGLQRVHVDMIRIAKVTKR